MKPVPVNQQRRHHTSNDPLNLQDPLGLRQDDVTVSASIGSLGSLKLGPTGSAELCIGQDGVYPDRPRRLDGVSSIWRTALGAVALVFLAMSCSPEVTAVPRVPIVDLHTGERNDVFIGADHDSYLALASRRGGRGTPVSVEAVRIFDVDDQLVETLRVSSTGLSRTVPIPDRTAWNQTVYDPPIGVPEGVYRIEVETSPPDWTPSEGQYFEVVQGLPEGVGPPL